MENQCKINITIAFIVGMILALLLANQITNKSLSISFIIAPFETLPR